jgi:hypothetical protein
MKGPGKGRTNNPFGRPKGASNKITKEVREVLHGIVKDELQSLPSKAPGTGD